MNKENILSRLLLLENRTGGEIEDLRPLFTHLFGYQWAVTEYGEETAAEVYHICAERGLPVEDAPVT